MGKPLNEEQARARAAKPATHAISIDAPWAWCITHAGKRVENRTWMPPASLLGHRFAIHAGLSRELLGSGFGGLDEELGAHGIIVPRAQLVFGAVVATAKLVGAASGHGSAYTAKLGALGPLMRDRIAVRDGLWFSGPIGWVIDEIIVMPRPVACRGAQGLWTLHSAQEREVLAQEAEVRDAA